MTMRLVPCDVCQRLYDYQVMHMCPVCRIAICRNCKHDGPLRTGVCARKVPCPGKKGLEAVEGPKGL